jgi:hypothetical protein
MCDRIQCSPVPTQTTLGSLGATAMAPMDWPCSLSKIGVQCTPPSVDFQMPPEAAPA